MRWMACGGEITTPGPSYGDGVRCPIAFSRITDGKEFANGQELIPINVSEYVVHFKIYGLERNFAGEEPAVQGEPFARCKLQVNGQISTKVVYPGWRIEITKWGPDARKSLRKEVDKLSEEERALPKLLSPLDAAKARRRLL